MDGSSKAGKKIRLGKLTMKEPYSKSRLLSKKIRGYIDLLRPFTLAAPFIVSMSIMVAGLIYSGISIPSDWWFTIGNASLTIAIVNAASNSLNQSTDIESDRISKPYRPIPRGVVRPEEAQSLAYILYLFALIRAVTISVWFGIFVFLIMVFTVTYSLPPRMKKHLFVNQIWIAIPRGLFGILASWSVFGDPIKPLPLTIGLIAMFYLIGGMSTKDIIDSKADRLTGVNTMINTYGVRKTAIISFPFMFFPFAFIPMLINIGFIDEHMWPLTLLVFLSLFVFYLMIKGSESKTLENIHAWSMMYVVYIFFALGFAVLTIFSEELNIPSLPI